MLLWLKATDLITFCFAFPQVSLFSQTVHKLSQGLEEIEVFEQSFNKFTGIPFVKAAAIIQPAILGLQDYRCPMSESAVYLCIRCCLGNLNSNLNSTASSFDRRISAFKCMCNK